MCVFCLFRFCFKFCHNTRCELRVALSNSQQQQCRATQNRCMLGIFVFLQPTKHWHGLQDLYSVCMIFCMCTHTRPLVFSHIPNVRRPTVQEPLRFLLLYSLLIYVLLWICDVSCWCCCICCCCFSWLFVPLFFTLVRLFVVIAFQSGQKWLKFHCKV